MQMLDEAVGRAEDGDAADEDWEPVRLDVNVDAYVPADYIPYEQAKVDVHRRIAGGARGRRPGALREELRDRFGELPEPLKNLISLQQARIKLGQAGARAVTFRGDRLAVTPIELDSVRAKKIRAEIPEALYESGKSQLSVRVPKDPGRAIPGGRARRGRPALSHARGRQRRPPPEHPAPGSGYSRILRPCSDRPATIGRVHEVSEVHPGARRLFCGRRARLAALRQRRARQLGRGRGRQPDHDPGVQPLDVRRRQGAGGPERPASR